MIITVATREEMEALIPKDYWYCTIVTGMGIMNTIMSLKYVQCDRIINIGYAGAKDIPVGTICMVTENEPYQVHNLPLGIAPVYEPNIDLPRYKCYTATDFIESSELEGPFLVDMELLAHLVLKVPVTSIKIVSDNMSLDDYYNKALKEDYTEEIGKILEEVFR